ncbi:polysaccharide pyruvyl transferase family protein [Jiangella rhizosphaerae]|uniref:Polysaccharide pyruvyl transferase family protein n=2 Tax=Jiangella rhizosphaerae TaxID=2293569 RepID=A0A418KYK3_9ACTN|nr:polysaccharide pyruvyl transferase family protein [Jiangella rhizosphaerae]
MTPRILLRASWQTANIGDVAHAPGGIQAIQRAAPDAEIVLWPVWLDERERAMLAAHLPEVTIVEGGIDAGGCPDSAALQAEFDAADLLVHGSGPSPLRAGDVRAWRTVTGKPYGFLGVTFDPFDPPQQATLPELELMIGQLPPVYLDAGLRDLLDHAAFVYCRDSLSLAYLRAQGVRSDVLELGPDATFACDVVDHEAAAATMAEFGLAEGRFACVIPAVRWTPYYRLRGFAPGQEHWRRDAVNALYTEADMAPLREGIVAWVRRTGCPVLIVPEMVHEVELGLRYLASGYPDDVQPFVHHLPRFWPLEEAAGVYARAAAVFGHECHSPIIASSYGTPGLYVREPCDTVKGRMYADLGLPHAQVEVTDGAAAVVGWVERVIDDPAGMRAVTRAGNERARALLSEAATVVTKAAEDGAVSWRR